MKAQRSDLFLKVIVCLLPVAFGLLFLAVGAGYALSRPRERVYVPAVIERIERDRGRDDDQYTIYLSYDVDGERHEGKLHHYRLGYQKGTVIEIYYNREYPGLIGLKSSDLAFEASFIGFGTFVTVIGCAIMWRAFFAPGWKRRKKTDLPLKNSAIPGMKDCE